MIKSPRQNPEKEIPEQQEEAKVQNQDNNQEGSIDVESPEVQQDKNDQSIPNSQSEMAAQNNVQNQEIPIQNQVGGVNKAILCQKLLSVLPEAKFSDLLGKKLHLYQDMIGAIADSMFDDPEKLQNSFEDDKKMDEWGKALFMEHLFEPKFNPTHKLNRGGNVSGEESGKEMSEGKEGVEKNGEGEEGFDDISDGELELSITTSQNPAGGSNAPGSSGAPGPQATG